MTASPTRKALKLCGWLGALGLGVVQFSGCNATGALGLKKPAGQGLQVHGRRISEADGGDFVMRGVNVMHTWYRDKTLQSLTDIAATGANTVRLVLSNGDRWEKVSSKELTQLLDASRSKGLAVVVEVHDTTGLGDEPLATTLDRAVDYWVDNKAVLLGREAEVIINLGNEPLGNGHEEKTWVDINKRAISRMRAAGFRHLLMIDAASWAWSGSNPELASLDLVEAFNPQRPTAWGLVLIEHPLGLRNTAAPFRTLKAR